jgi:2-aminoethylphosphonate dioxygenase
MTTAPPALRRGVLGTGQVVALAQWATEIEAWPAGSHVWGHYAEETATGPAICRTENVSACHPGVAALVDGGLRELAEAELGEPATAFKDKLNYKQPGGAGFSPHQDRRAYPGVDRVLSVLVAVDECSTASGCLWLADGVGAELPTDERGVVRADVCEELRWEPAELAPGDAVCIDGLAPHYSEANRSQRPRRVLVASYAPSREGYGRDRYYDARAAEMTTASERDGHFRISTLADFEGDEVATGAAAVARCTHG